MTHNHSPKSLVGRQKIRFICNAPILENLNEILTLHACVPVQVKPAWMCSGASKTCMLPPKCIQISTMPHNIPTTDFTSFGLVWIFENLNFRVCHVVLCTCRQHPNIYDGRQYPRASCEVNFHSSDDWTGKDCQSWRSPVVAQKTLHQSF